MISQLFCNPFYSTMSAAAWNLQARNSFGTYMQPDYVWNTLPWQLMPQSWGMYLKDAFSIFNNGGLNNNSNLYGNNFTPGASIYSNTSYFENYGKRVSDPALDTNQSVEDLAKDIAEREKYESNYKKLDSILKSLKDSTNPANLTTEKQAYIKATYAKMSKYTTTQDKYEALKACYDALVKDNDTKLKIEKYLLSKYKIDQKEIGEQLKSIGLVTETNDDIAQNLVDKIKNCDQDGKNVADVLSDVTVDNILEVMSVYNDKDNTSSLIDDIANKFNNIKDNKNIKEKIQNYKSQVLRQMQTLMKSRAERVLANSDINDDEKAKIKKLVDNIEDCTNNASKFGIENLKELYKLLRQTEARILENKLKKEYACLGESGLKINLVEKINADLKSEGFSIDNEKKNNESIATSSSSNTETAQAKNTAKSSEKTDTNTNTSGASDY